MIDKSYIEEMVATEINEFADQFVSGRFAYLAEEKIRNELPTLMRKKLIERVSEFIESELELENLCSLFTTVVSEDVLRGVKLVQGELKNE